MTVYKKYMELSKYISVYSEKSGKKKDSLIDLHWNEKPG